jgi:hypothetical protein
MQSDLNVEALKTRITAYSRSQDLIGISIAEEALQFFNQGECNANSTGEQPHGHINCQQEIACGRVRRMRRQDVS